MSIDVFCLKNSQLQLSKTISLLTRSSEYHFWTIWFRTLIKNQGMLKEVWFWNKRSCWWRPFRTQMSGESRRRTGLRISKHFLLNTVFGAFAIVLVTLQKKKTMVNFTSRKASIAIVIDKLLPVVSARISKQIPTNFWNKCKSWHFRTIWIRQKSRKFRRNIKAFFILKNRRLWVLKITRTQVSAHFGFFGQAGFTCKEQNWWWSPKEFFTVEELPIANLVEKVRTPDLKESQFSCPISTC